MSIGAKYAPFGVRCCLLRGDYYFFLLYQTIVATRPETCRQKQESAPPICASGRGAVPDSKEH